MTNGQVLRELPALEDRIGGGVFSQALNVTERLLLTWAGKDQHIESGGGPSEIGDRTARLFRVEGSEGESLLSGHKRAINTAAFGPDDEFVVTGSDDRTARVWSTRGRELAVLRGHLGAVTTVAVNPSGDRILTVSADGTARLWDPGCSRVTERSPAQLFELRYGVPLPKLTGGGSLAELPQLSANRTVLLARTGQSRGLQLWNARSGVWLRELGDPAAFENGELHGWLSPDGARVVTTNGDMQTATGDEEAVVWDTHTGARVHALNGHAGPVYKAVYSADGRHIATVGEDGHCRVWNAQSFQLTHDLAVSDGRVVAAAFSRDSTRLATASRDSLVKVWDVETGHLSLELFGHEGGAADAAFSPDDSLVVSVGEDGTRLWDAVSGKHLGMYLGVERAFITPDCRTLVTGSYAEPERVRLHSFAACGSVERLLSAARTRTFE